jgi:hypothetical protein
MTDQPAYELLVGEQFLDDLRRTVEEADHNPGGKADFLRRQIFREMSDLMSGASNGHHVLGYEAGKGDLRDCVASKLQSDPQHRADHRLTFREIPAMNLAGDLNGRELLAIQPRHGDGNIYEATSARLGRDLQTKQPNLDRFGDRPASSGGNQAQRQADRDAKPAIAHAWAGQKPLSTSRPLDAAQFGGRRPPRTAPSSARPASAKTHKLTYWGFGSRPKASGRSRAGR